MCFVGERFWLPRPYSTRRGSIPQGCRALPKCESPCCHVFPPIPELEPNVNAKVPHIRSCLRVKLPTWATTRFAPRCFNHTKAVLRICVHEYMLTTCNNTRIFGCCATRRHKASRRLQPRIHFCARQAAPRCPL